MTSTRLLGHTQAEYGAHIKRLLGKGAEHAKLIHAEYMRTGKVEAKTPAFDNAQILLGKILEASDWTLPKLIDEQQEGQTRKLWLEPGIESVIIPMESGWTLCVSSQVGCRMGCAFCETGKMGLVRNLTVEEIVGQWFVARHQLGVPIRSIVFMGMGEPLDNYDNVLQAVHVLGEQIGYRHISVSTCGKVEEIYRLIDDAPPSMNLAVSVNAPNDAVRRKIMPVNAKHDMAELKRAMQAWCAHPRRQILAEYVLIEGINEDADQLADYLQGVRCKINVIPYNPQRRDRFARPAKEQIDAFVQRLRERGYFVSLRATKGDEMMAACGQLGGRLARMSSHGIRTRI